LEPNVVSQCSNLTRRRIMLLHENPNKTMIQIKNIINPCLEQQQVQKGDEQFFSCVHRTLVCRVPFLIRSSAQGKSSRVRRSRTQLERDICNLLFVDLPPPPHSFLALFLALTRRGIKEGSKNFWHKKAARAKRKSVMTDANRWIWT
jgi:hypothetical protein